LWAFFLSSRNIFFIIYDKSHPKISLEILGKGDPSKAARARKKREARRIYESPAKINNLRRGNYFCAALPDKIIKKDRSRVKGKPFKNALLQGPIGPQFHAGILNCRLQLPLKEGTLGVGVIPSDSEEGTGSGERDRSNRAPMAGEQAR